MKTVYFDVRHISKGGIGVYIGEVLKRLVHCNVSLYLITSDPEEVASFLSHDNVKALKAPKLFSIAEQIWFFSKRRMLRNQVYLSPYLTFPLFQKFKLIYIVNDLIWLIYPRYATGRLGYFYFKFFVTRGVKSSNTTIAISNNTKTDILRFIHTTHSKIKVIYLGIDKREFEGIEPQTPDYKYFVYVGTFKPWKNVPVLLEAFTFLLNTLSNDRSVKLILCGDSKTNKSDNIEGIIQESRVLRDTVRITGKIARKELLSLIKGSVALIQPSQYEGFGFAPLEGLALGVPVICADIPVTREIVSDKAVYFKLGDSADLCDKMVKSLTSPGMDISERMLAKQQVFERYDWDNNVRQLLDIIASA